jgi:hypothetical protein
LLRRHSLLSWQRPLWKISLLSSLNKTYTTFKKPKFPENTFAKLIRHPALSLLKHLQKIPLPSSLTTTYQNNTKNTKTYLQNVQAPCTKLAEAPPEAIPNILPDILNLIRMIWRYDISL